MKILYTFSILIIAVSIINGQDLVRNGGFENANNFEYWDSSVTVTGASVQPVDIVAHSGSWSVEIKTGISPVGGWTELSQDLLPPANNLNYRLTIWIKDSVASSNFVGVYGLTGSGEVALGIDSLNNSVTTSSDSGRITITQNFYQNWGRVFYYFNSGENYTGYVLKFQEATDGNSLTVHLDDIGILPVPGQSIIEVTAPNGGENWIAGTHENITWTSSNVTNVKIDYSTNNGNLWQNIAASIPAVNGSYDWTIPNTPASQCLVRVSDASVASRYDISDSTFSIISIITVTTPNGGEVWFTGEQHDITWNSINILSVNIEYSTDNGGSWNSVADSINASTGSYYWTIPAASSSQCLVRISDVDNSTIFDVSDANFTISNPYVTVVAPNGGESWRALTFRTVNWNSQDISNVKIEYSTDNGSNWLVVIASKPAGTGAHVWVVPNTPSTQCLVRISDVNDATINDVSDSTFTIEEPVSVENLDSGIPDEYELYQNFPNPFNPSTTINFSLPEETDVSLSIYNTLGQKVAQLVNSKLEAGRYKYQWDAGNIATGIYIYELRTDSFVSLKKMILLR